MLRQNVMEAPNAPGGQVRFRLLMGTVLVSVTAACVSTNATVLNTSLKRPAIPPDSVVIYLSASEVPRSYDEIAILNSKGDAGLTNERQMYSSMRKKAGQLGANGIILNSTKDPGTGAKVAHALLGTSANRKGKAIAIYVHPDTAATARGAP